MIIIVHTEAQAYGNEGRITRGLELLSEFGLVAYFFTCWLLYHLPIAFAMFELFLDINDPALLL